MKKLFLLFILSLGIVTSHAVPATFLSINNFVVHAAGEGDAPPGGGEGDNKPSYCSSIDQRELRSSIIPCGRKVHICYDEENAQCEFRHLFVLVNNMARNFITVVFAPLLVLILMYIGVLFVKDQAAAKTKAKMLLSRVLIGTFFVLGAWLVVSFILNALETKDEVQQPLKTNQ